MSQLLVQETAVRIPTPVGTGSAVQEAPALTVPMMTGLPKMPNPTAVQSDVVAHETPLSPSTSGGMACWLHAYPSLTEDNTVFHPTAKQFAVDGHDAELRRLVPAGGVRAVHDRPPVVVVMMVDPAPMLPLLPTATQSAGAEQEIPVTSTALLGGLWSDQVEPLLDVLTTYGVELRLVPTAMQVVSFVTDRQRLDCCRSESRLVDRPVTEVRRAERGRRHRRSQFRRRRNWTWRTQDTSDSEQLMVARASLHVVPSSGCRRSMVEPSTTPTATHVRALGHETLAQGVESGRRLSASSKSDPFVVSDDPIPAHRRALIDSEARDRLSRKRRVLNRPTCAAVARLHDPRTAAGVTDSGRRTRDRGQGGDAGWGSRVGPGGAAILGHDDGGDMATVVAHGHAGRGTGRHRRSTGDGVDVGQRREAGRRLPCRSDRRGREGRHCRDSYPENPDQGNDDQRRQSSDGDTPNRSHRHLPPTRRAHQ